MDNRIAWLDTHKGDGKTILVRYKTVEVSLGRIRCADTFNGEAMIRALNSSYRLGIQQGKKEVRQALGISK